MTNENEKKLPTDTIVGIDLGTTNSLLAVYQEGKINIIEIDGSQLLPSYAGLSPANELLVGHPARNQYILYPDRTIKSVKRRMGGTEKLNLGDRLLLPEEVSALILGHLKSCAEKILGIPICRAVITVPAYFNDTQRQATRVAGRDCRIGSGSDRQRTHCRFAGIPQQHAIPGKHGNRDFGSL